MDSPDLEFEAARYALGDLSSDDLVHLADSLLSSGTYSATADELASADNPVTEEAGPLFERILRESGVQLPSRDEAVEWLLCAYVRQIADGSRAPRGGLRLVHRVYMAADEPVVPMSRLGASHGLQELLECYHSYEEPLAWAPGESEQAAAARLDDEAVVHAREWLKDRCA